ncbi:hypothetical protein H920_00494 [Fukomys damarensis]|uniref:Transcription factor COE DNA-binding domain-containing protein n=1 Tax=Fukomys damarensis TaxID=885580 RepID=A0A091E151_FUKDA|nr:hypothetical protein H920_00494 [Fukomys damarensis]
MRDAEGASPDRGVRTEQDLYVRLIDSVTKQLVSDELGASIFSLWHDPDSGCRETILRKSARVQFGYHQYLLDISTRKR